MSDYDLVLASLAAVHAKLDMLLEPLKVPGRCSQMAFIYEEVENNDGNLEVYA